MEEKKNNNENKNSVFDGFKVYSDSLDLLIPIVSFGLYVYILDKIFDGKFYFMISGVFIGFILVNISIYRRVKSLIKKYDQDKNKKDNKEN